MSTITDSNARVLTKFRLLLKLVNTLTGKLMARMFQFTVCLMDSRSSVLPRRIFQVGSRSNHLKTTDLRVRTSTKNRVMANLQVHLSSRANRLPTTSTKWNNGTENFRKRDQTLCSRKTRKRPKSTLRTSKLSVSLVKEVLVRSSWFKRSVIMPSSP